MVPPQLNSRLGFINPGLTLSWNMDNPWQIIKTISRYHQEDYSLVIFHRTVRNITILNQRTQWQLEPSFFVWPEGTLKDETLEASAQLPVFTKLRMGLKSASHRNIAAWIQVLRDFSLLPKYRKYIRESIGNVTLICIYIYIYIEYDIIYHINLHTYITMCINIYIYIYTCLGSLSKSKRRCVIPTSSQQT